MMRPGFGTSCFKSRDEIIGTKVKATNRLAAREVIARAMSVRSLVMPYVNTIGRNTAIVVKVEAVIAPATWLVPSTAEVWADRPSLRIR